AVANASSTTSTTSGSFRRTERAFYGGGRAHAGGPAAACHGGVRGVRERRQADPGSGLPGGRTLARVPAAARAGGPPRLLALAVDVARCSRQLPQARERRRRLRARRQAAGRDRARAETRRVALLSS